MPNHSPATFWSKFKSVSKPGRHTREYNFTPGPAARSGFFSGWWPFKLLVFPFWILWKLVRQLG